MRTEPLELPAADIGPENPLPEFRLERDNRNFAVAPDLPEEERRYIGWEIGKRILPYRIQDGYSRQLEPRVFRSVVLENEFLRAVFLPELGGRLVSLYHKPGGRDLVEPVRMFQPANLALRNA